MSNNDNSKNDDFFFDIDEIEESNNKTTDKFENKERKSPDLSYSDFENDSDDDIYIEKVTPQKPVKSSLPKSYYKNNNSSKILWAIIFILAVVIIVEIFVLLFGNNEKNPPDVIKNSPIITNTPVPGNDNTDNPELTPDVTSDINTEAPTNEISDATPTPYKTSEPTNTPKPTNTPAPSSGYNTVAKIIDPNSIDFSFLSGKSTGTFDDGSPIETVDGVVTKRSYDWYPGKVVYDEATGKSDYKWDRYQSTLKLLGAYNGIYRLHTEKKVIYLTFDCGYEYGHTTKILDTLKEKNAPAIFFVTGGFLDDKDNWDLLKRMYNEGHLIGNHTNNHKIMPTVSNTEFVSELNYVYQKCKDILGNEFEMAYYRPPQGASCERDLALANYLGYNSTFWAFAYGDYDVNNQPDHAKALDTMKGYLHPGAVYLLHAISETNAAVLGDFIDWVIAQGYTIDRIDK